MNTYHIKTLKLVNGTWVMELRNSQIIQGTKNLAESIESLSLHGHVWPMPVWSDTIMKLNALDETVFIWKNVA